MTTDQTAENNEDVLYCTVHPNRETGLRCNKCNRPMCLECAVRTPVGYRCRTCVNQQQNTYFNPGTYDYPIAAAVAFLMSTILGGLLIWFNVLLLNILLSAPLGGLISEAVNRATGKRRGRHTWWVVGLATGLGALPVVLIKWGPVFQAAAIAGVPITEVISLIGFQLLGVVLYLVLASATAAARFRYGGR